MKSKPFKRLITLLIKEGTTKSNIRNPKTGKRASPPPPPILKKDMESNIEKQETEGPKEKEIHAKAGRLIDEFRKTNDFPIQAMDEQLWYICQQNAIKCCNEIINALSDFKDVAYGRIEEMEAIKEAVKNYQI